MCEETSSEQERESKVREKADCELLFVLRRSSEPVPAATKWFESSQAGFVRISSPCVVAASVQSSFSDQNPLHHAVTLIVINRHS